MYWMASNPKNTKHYDGEYILADLPGGSLKCILIVNYNLRF